MPDFARFDQRHYRMVTAQEGYGAWQPTYESTVQDAMDLALLDRSASPGSGEQRGCPRPPVFRLRRMALSEQDIAFLASNRSAAVRQGSMRAVA